MENVRSRLKLCLLLLLGLLISGLLLFVLRNPAGLLQLNTRTTRPDLQECFTRITNGSTLDAVYAIAGNPLMASIQDGASQKLATEVGLEYIKNSMNSTNVQVTLIYSKPRSSGVIPFLYYYAEINYQGVTSVNCITMD